MANAKKAPRKPKVLPPALTAAIARVEKLTDKSTDDERKAARAELKKQKFAYLAPLRVVKVLNALRQLGQLGNRGGYSYDEAQVTKMFKAVETAAGEAHAKFNASQDAAAKGASFNW